MSKVRFVDSNITVNSGGESGGSSISSSYALTASYADFATSASYAVSASYEIVKEVSSSYADTASFAISSSHAVSASYAPISLPSGLVSGSSQVSYTGLSNIPSGIISGSSQLPSGLVSGSTQINAFTLSASGSFSGSFQGNGSELIGVISSSYSTTASYVETAQTASYVLNAVSSSYAVTASHALNIIPIPSGTVSGSAQISSLGFVTSSATASFVTNSQTSSMSVLSASFAVTASHALNIIPITPGTLSGSAQISDLGFVTSSATASFVTNSQTSSMSVLSASFAVTASHLLNNPPPFPFTGDAVISGSLTISGSLLNTGTVSIDDTDSPYTITGTQQFILIDPSGGDVTVNMPDASTYPGRQIFFKLTQAAGANTVTLQRQGSDTIDGATIYDQLDIQFESISTVSNGGTGWFIF